MRQSEAFGKGNVTASAMFQNSKRLTVKSQNVGQGANKMMLTEATSTPWLCAMWPRIEKVTVPASKHVAVFTRHVITVSLVEIR